MALGVALRFFLHISPLLPRTPGVPVEALLTSRADEFGTGQWARRAKALGQKPPSKKRPPEGTSHARFIGQPSMLNGCFMPAISMFYGLIVYMYFLDNKQHNRPHIHVMYQDQEVIVTIPQGEVLSGSIPANKMKLLQAWIELHQDELIADWTLAASGQMPYKINPLK